MAPITRSSTTATSFTASSRSRAATATRSTSTSTSSNRNKISKPGKRQYKTICGVKNSYGKACQNKKSGGGLDTCLIHSGNLDFICGQLTRSKDICKQLKGKCKYHSEYSPAIKVSTQCTGLNRNGTQCQQMTLNPPLCTYHSKAKSSSSSSSSLSSSVLCGFSNTLSGIPCRRLVSKSKSNSLCPVHENIKND